jgi:hypothetical protein
MFAVIVDVVVVVAAVHLLVAVGANVVNVVVVVAAVVVDVGISFASVLGCRLCLLRLLCLF